MTPTRALKLSLLAVGTSLSLIACSPNAQDAAPSSTSTATTTASAAAETTAEKHTITFTDQADHEVTVATPVDRMVVLQHHSLDILAQLGAQDKVVATEAKWKQNLGDYIEDMYPDLAHMPTPGDLKSMKVEDVAALKPDIVLVAAQANPEDLAKLDKLQIPYATVSLRSEGKQVEAQNPRLADSDKAYTEGLQWTVETLGKLTGTEDRAAKLWSFIEESRQFVEDKVGDIPEAERPKVFIANPENKTYGNDKYVGAQLLRAGAVNVAAKDIQGYKSYNFEQLVSWDPDYIIVQDRYPEVYKEVTTAPEWQALSAVQSGKVLLAPYWSKPWGNPDTDSMALGELWLAHQFYPEKITAADVQKRAEDFYSTFYGVKFTDKV